MKMHFSQILKSIFLPPKKMCNDMNLSPFQNSKDIEDPQILFGREEDLRKLCDYANGLHQVQIIGARRFGKTCLIKSFITQHKQNTNRRAYPVYIDLYSDGVIGTANVYRYFIAQILSSLYIDGYINGDVIVDNYTITLDKKWKKIRRQLKSIDNDDIIDFFDEVVEWCSRKIGQTILLLFDEYEKAIDSFDNINGLMHLRQLTNGSTDIMFWIIGATPWETLILDAERAVIRGSGVFNGIGIPLYVRPISYLDYKKMWLHECHLITDEIKRKNLESLCDKIYESSGGVPCFAKEIGAIVNIESKYPHYDRLNIHFAEIVKTLDNAEMRSLRDLQSSPKEFAITEKPKSIKALEEYGIICLDNNNRYFISSRFFADYLRAKMCEEQSSPTENIDFNKYVEDIAEKICRINDIWFNQCGMYMFDFENDTQRHYSTLRKPCDNPDQFSSFINAIYLIYWEGAKENDIAGDKIPEYFKKTMFRLSMDRIRHVFGKAHEKYKLTTRYGQVNITTALSEITGYSTEPETPEEWLSFQECMLKRFLKELSDIYKSITPDVQSGKSYTGVIVEVPKADGRVFKNVKSEISHRLLRIKNSDLSDLHDGDIITFIAKQEADPNDPLMTYWVAYDVHID